MAFLPGWALNRSTTCNADFSRRVPSAGLIEIIFIFLAASALLSITVLRNQANIRIAALRRETELLQMAEAHAGTYKDLEGDGFQQSLREYRKKLTGLSHLDGAIISLLEELPSVSQTGETRFQPILDHLYSLETRIRSGFQSLQTLYTLLLGFILIVSVMKYYQNRSRITGLEWDKALAERHIQIQREEQRVLARELHDGTAQHILRVRFLLQSMGQTPGQAREQTGGQVHEQAFRQTILDSVYSSLDDALMEIRRLCGLLRIPELNSPEILLEQTGQLFTQKNVIPVKVLPACAADDPGESKWTANDCYEINRMVQEGLNNIARHSGADAVILRIVETGSHLRIILEDNGKGISGPPGLGMKSIQERAALLSGSINWREREGGGTLMVVDIPLPETWGLKSGRLNGRGCS